MSITRRSFLFRWGKALGIALAMALATACANEPRINTANSDLVEVQRGNFDHVLMLPDQPLGRLTHVTIGVPEVEMSDYWLRDHRSEYTERDLERIKNDYGLLLQETLTKNLAEQTRLEFVDSADADVILRPRLRELNIYAPDLSVGLRDNYVESAGNATFDLELVDPSSGTVVAQFIDHRETPPIVVGRLEETNRATNRRMFRRLIERWTNNLVDYFDKEGIAPRR